MEKHINHFRDTKKKVRLIDADALKAKFPVIEKIAEDLWYGAAIRVAIDRAPTIDAVEVAEYNAVIEKLENLLCHATGGKYSKAGYSWEDMERMVTDYIEECCEEAVAEEVVHAYWIGRPLDNFRKYEVKCSECGFIGIGNYDQYLEPCDFNYCPNCGAKMDGERKDNG